ncbi:hypothetical protein [Erwinia sp. ErVv1]|nr:hypothetical protein [Erwinia sp. ErVv1]
MKAKAEEVSTKERLSESEGGRSGREGSGCKAKDSRDKPLFAWIDNSV